MKTTATASTGKSSASRCCLHPPKRHVLVQAMRTFGQHPCVPLVLRCCRVYAMRLPPPFAMWEPQDVVLWLVCRMSIHSGELGLGPGQTAPPSKPLCSLVLDSPCSKLPSAGRTRTPLR